MSIATLLSYVNDCKKPLGKQKCSPHQRLRDRSDTMTGRLMPFHWRQVTWSWLRLVPTGKRKVKDQWEVEPYEVEHQVVKESLCTS